MKDPEAWQQSPAHRALSLAGKSLTQPGSLQKLYRRCMKALWWLTTLASLIYSLAVPSAMLACDKLAESTWFTACLIYMPWGIWLLPLPIIAMLALLARPLALLPLIIPIISVFWYLDFNWTGERKAPEDAWRLISASMGQRSRVEAFKLLDRVNPKLIIMQEAQNLRGYLSYSKDYNQLREGEYHTISHFSILEATPVQFPDLYFPPVALRCLLADEHGNAFVLYNVHLPTPRQDFRRMQGRNGLLKTILKREGFLSEYNRKRFEEAMERRVQMAERLADKISQETLPTIAAGDFNVPRRSQSYRIYNRILTDAHDIAGFGTDMTFPGYSKNPLALFKPWLRLDYIFVNQHWEVYQYRTEKSRQPQHLAVTALLRLKQPDYPSPKELSAPAHPTILNSHP